jgi:hypothetical protein
MNPIRWPHLERQNDSGNTKNPGYTGYGGYTPEKIGVSGVTKSETAPVTPVTKPHGQAQAVTAVTAQKPTPVTQKPLENGSVTAVTAVTAPKSIGECNRALRTPERFTPGDCASFERIATALRAEFERRPALAGIAAYRPVLDRQTGERLTAMISARRQADGAITVSEIAGDWADPTLPDLETWTPSGEAS